MMRKSGKESQGHLLYEDVPQQLNPKDALLQLAARLPWAKLEEEFSSLYAECGRPAKPVRLMVGLLLLKQLENLSACLRRFPEPTMALDWKKKAR